MNDRQYSDAKRHFVDGFNIIDRGGVKTVEMKLFEPENGLKHGFSTRVGGISERPYDTMNLSLSREGEAGSVMKNYSILCNACGLNFDDMVVVAYEHGDTVLRVDANDRGRGFSKASLPPCDAIITNERGVTLITCHADCSVYYLYDPVERVIGLAHAGWRGTLARIGANVVQKMAGEYGSKPQNIMAAVGPCICGKCFEVDQELAERFISEFGCKSISRQGREGKAFLDIEAAAAIQFLEAGVRPENIGLAHACTYERDDIFFSYRRDHGETGAMAAYLSLL